MEKGNVTDEEERLAGPTVGFISCLIFLNRVFWWKTKRLFYHPAAPHSWLAAHLIIAPNFQSTSPGLSWALPCTETKTTKADWKIRVARGRRLLKPLADEKQFNVTWRFAIILHWNSPFESRWFLHLKRRGQTIRIIYLKIIITVTSSPAASKRQTVWTFAGVRGLKLQCAL